MEYNFWWAYLAEQLDERDWTPADLSRASGVSQSRIAHWRDTGAVPSIKNARAIAAALDVPLLIILVEARVISSDEAMLRANRRPSLDEVPTRRLLREVERRIGDLESIARGWEHMARTKEEAREVPAETVNHPTSSPPNSLSLVADRPNTDMLRDQQERAWASDAELPDPAGPETGA